MYLVIGRAALAACLCSSLAIVPAAGAEEPPLPDANNFMQGLFERQRAHEEALDSYSYDVLQVEEQLDKQGSVKERKSRSFEVFHVHGQPVRRQVAEDDRPLDAKKLADVDKKVRKEVAEIIKGKRSEDPKKKEDEALKLSAILARYDFRSVAREDVLGRPALVVDFSARPGKWKVEADNVLRNLTGRMWIDEAAREIVRAEIRNTGGIKFALGIGASLSQLSATLEFQRVDEEVWLPLRIEARAAGRILLLKGFRIRSLETYSRYRRFQVETDEVVNPVVPLP